jgi:hypothetical protein
MSKNDTDEAVAAANDKVYRWFSHGTPASSNTKTGRHAIAEILLKVALSTMSQINHKLVYYLIYPPELEVKETTDTTSISGGRSRSPVREPPVSFITCGCG